MTYTETRYFRTEPCPAEEGAWHVAPIVVSSPQPITMITPTITPDEVDVWHVCQRPSESPTSPGEAR